MSDHISIQRITNDAVDDFSDDLVKHILSAMEPKGGDYVIIRASPERAEAIANNLSSQLFTQGARERPVYTKDKLED